MKKNRRFLIKKMEEEYLDKAAWFASCASGVMHIWGVERYEFLSTDWHQIAAYRMLNRYIKQLEAQLVKDLNEEPN